MKETKKCKLRAHCEEDEIHIIERDENGIKTKKYVKISKMDDKFLITSPSIFAMIAALATDAILIFYALNTPNLLLIFSSSYFAASASLPFFNFIFKMIPLKLGNKKWRQAAKVHAAMHMAVNAFNKKGSTPTIEEMKKSSYIVDNCSCFSSTCNVICAMLYLVFSFFVSNWIVILILYPNIFIFSHLFNSGGLFNNFQKLILSKPTDEELKLVLEHLESMDRFEELCNSETYNVDDSK